MLLMDSPLGSSLGLGLGLRWEITKLMFVTLFTSLPHQILLYRSYQVSNVFFQTLLLKIAKYHELLS
jgi:hypothetical protein